MGSFLPLGGLGLIQQHMGYAFVHTMKTQKPAVSLGAVLAVGVVNTVVTEKAVGIDTARTKLAGRLSGAYC